MDEIDKYYQILGLKSESSEKEILEAYKVSVKVWDPHRFSDDPHIQKIATEKIREIDEAFKKLLIRIDSHPEKGNEITEPQLEVKTEPPETNESIVIQTEPSEAEVYFDEKFVGTSPCRGKHLPVGSYRVRVIKEGYEIWEKNIDIKAGAKEEVFAKLKLREPESGQTWKDPYFGMEFVYVKGGRFEMGDTFGDGDTDEKPVHEVCLDGFWISKYVVTQGQWKKLMNNNPSEFKSGDNYPVEGVNWFDTQKFISRLNEKTGINYRLPTEAEWEYAARSGGKREKWAGTNLESKLHQYAWHYFNSQGKTHPVGERKPNGLGLYDMTGNVWEWVQDLYDRHYYKDSPQDNPQRSDYGSDRIIRGGCWKSEAIESRTTIRYIIGPKEVYGVGFRLVLPAQPQQPYSTEEEKPSKSKGISYGTPKPSLQEPLHQPSSKPEPPPRQEKRESLTTENTDYTESEPSLDEPPLEANGVGAIWNPNAAAIWSLPFTPAFGSYLEMLNWRTLNEPAKASSAQSWFYASLLMLFICFLTRMFISDAEVRHGIIFLLSFPYLITWYFAAGRSQEKYVKAKFGTNYPKKPWGQALLIAVGALIVWCLPW